MRCPSRMQTMSGCTPVCSTAHHFPVRPTPLCTSSTTSRMPCLSQIRRNSCMNTVGATTYPPSPWMGSTKMAATSSGGSSGLEELFFDEACAASANASASCGPPGAAIHVGITHVRHAWHQRSKTSLLLRLRGGQRKRAHGAAMERAEERDHVLPFGVIARKFQRGLDRLRARIAVINPMRSRHGSNLRQALRQLHHVLVIKIRARHVDQFARLLLDGGDHFGMAMPGRSHGDAGGEIQELVAVDVFTTTPRPRLATSG